MVRKDFRLRILTKVALYSYLRKQYVARKRWFYAGQALMTAVVIALSVVLQTYLQVKPPTYKLDSATYNLIGESRDDSEQYLTKDEKNSTFSFALPEDKDKSAKEHVGRVADIYEATLPTDAKKGITYTDTATKIGITVIPKFRTYEGKKVDGDHIVYPANGSSLIYTLKYNGLKEDIIVPKYSGNELDYEFELSLPSGVEARLDEQGNIGIYSSDTSLFGDISYGTDEDRAKVDKAREKAEKTNLVVTIPSPIVKDANGKEYGDKANFSLGDKQVKTLKNNSANKDLPAEVQKQLSAKSAHNVYSLKLSGHSLKDLPYPISLDPTIQTSSASDWNKVIPEGNVDVDSTNNLIKRGGLTGGTIPAFTAQTPTWNARGISGGFVHDGKLFMLGGIGDSSIWYVAIASDGTIGSTWTQSASTLPATDYNGYGRAIYNGFLYLSGGQLSGSTEDNTYYIKIKSLLSTSVATSFTSGTVLPVQTAAPASIANNGYLYVIGGRFTSTSLHNGIWTAKLKADGSTESWATSSATLNSVRWQLSAFSYNGRLYYGGGCNGNAGVLSADCGTPLSDVWSAPLNSDGTVGTFIQHTSFTGPRGGLSLLATNGYAYVAGGCSAVAGACSSGSILTDVQFAQINADGSLGAWQSTSSLATGRYFSASAIYQGNLYYMGGCTTPSNSGCNNSTSFRSVEYVKVNPAGTIGPNANGSNNNATARYYHATVVYNSWIYIIGGCSTILAVCGPSAGYLSSIERAQIASNGSVGAWQTVADTIPAAAGNKAGRIGVAAFVSLGYLYITGGVEANTLGTADTSMTDVYFASITSTGSLVATTVVGCTTAVWCRQTGVLTTARFFHTAIEHNLKMYILGGNSSASYGGTTASRLMNTADINSNGSLTGMAETTDKLITARYGHSSIAYGSYIYAVGGYSGSAYLDTIERAPITMSNGSIGTFTTTGNTAFTNARAFMGMSIRNGIMYIWGGGIPSASDTTLYSSVQMSNVNVSDGSVGSWSALGNSMGSNRYGFGGIENNGFIYGISGCTVWSSGANHCTTLSNTLNYLEIFNGGDGDVGTSTTTPVGSQRLSKVVFNHGLAVYDGYIYVIGGCGTNSSCGVRYSDVEKTKINDDGTLAGWDATNVPNIPAARSSLSAVVNNGYLYITGGTDGTSNLAEVYYTKIASNHGFTNPGCGQTWCTGTNMPAVRTTHNVQSYKNIIYVIGGNNNGTVWHVKPAADGSYGSWIVDSTANPMLAGTGNIPAFIYRDFVYSVGVGAGTSQFAPIDSSGNVGAWSRTTYTPKATVNAQSANVLNGYVYIAGGSVFGNNGNEIQYAPLLPNGQIGRWSFSANTMGSVKQHTETFIYNGYIYSVAGQVDSALFDSTQYVKINSIPRVGSYSKLIDFDTGVQPTKLITRGSNIASSRIGIDYKSVSNASATFTNSQSILDAGYYGANKQTFNLGTNITLSRYLWIRYTIDDKLSAAFPDFGNESTITEFDVYFTANPGKRLKGGRTFSDGADRGLGVTP